MKLINKIAISGLGFMFIGSSVFAQSLADAKKAIDAEQFQKAKSMLKNLVTTESAKDENYFYLGWVYIKQDYPDSAKTVFQKGIGVNPKSALNYVGLGVVAHLDKDKAGTSSNFAQAVALAGKDSKPYVYMGKGYLLPIAGAAVTPADAGAALDVLTKGNTASAVKNKDKSMPAASNDPELYMTMGEADRLLLKSNDAYTNFSNAQTLDPKAPNVYVALGVLWKFADNFEDAVKQFQQALSLDPNYGPAYREWAETDYRWAQSSPAQADVKIKEAVAQYKKYLSLTDNSLESQMRYADFLVNAGDYKTLQQVAADLSKLASSNLRVYRYLGYAAYENKDYPAGLSAMNTWMTKADPKRIITTDYVFYGRLQVASGDSTGIQTLKKALALDSNRRDIYGDIAAAYWAEKKYTQAGDAYAVYIAKGGRKVTLNDYLKEGISYYQSVDVNKPDTVVLNKADSAFSYILHKVTPPIPVVVYYRALVADAKDADRNNIKGLAKPYYEQYIALITAKTPPLADDEKKNLVSSYDYLGAYYQYKEKNEAKAAENYGKARDIDPTNKQALDYFKKKGGTKSK